MFSNSFLIVLPNFLLVIKLGGSQIWLCNFKCINVVIKIKIEI